MPTHNRILLLQLRHWDTITLDQANKLRECLYKLEQHLRSQYVERVAKRLTMNRKERKDLTTGVKLASNYTVEDDGKERFTITDAHDRKHFISY